MNLKYSEIASINTHNQTKIEKQENDIAELTTITKSYTETIEKLNQRNKELTDRIETLEVENLTLTNKLNQQQNGLSTIELLPLLYTLLSSVHKKKMESTEIYSMIIDTTKKLTGNDPSKDAGLKSSFEKLGCSNKTPKVSLPSTNKPTNIQGHYFTASPNNLKK